MKVMEIAITFLHHQKTDLIIATSPSHKGLMVHGRTVQEVEARIPEAIRALLEAEGKTVMSIGRTAPESQVSSFEPLNATFAAELCAA